MYDSEGNRVLFTDDRFAEQVKKQSDPKDALYAPSSVLYAGLERTWINYATYTMVLKVFLTAPVNLLKNVEDGGPVMSNICVLVTLALWVFMSWMTSPFLADHVDHEGRLLRF
jgi:hypothetical protein